MRTTAAISTPTGVQIDEIELRDLGRHDVLLRVLAANVGRADGHGADAPGASGPGGAMAGGPPLGDPPPGFPPQGPPPGPPPGPVPPSHQVNGHGGVAVVEEVGSAVERVRPGQRVIVVSTPNCGVCRFCVRGVPQYCALLVPFGPAYARMSDGTPVHGNSNVGMFGRHTITSEYQCIPVESELPDDQLALISNPIVTGAGAALVTAPVHPGDMVAVTGCGTVGLGYIQAARFAGAEKIVAIEPLAARRDAALRFGATHVVDPNATDPVAFVRELSGDGGGVLFAEGADYVFEASGEPRALEQAWAMTGLGGHLVSAGITLDPFATVSFSMTEFAVVAGRTVHPCQQGSALMARDLPRLVGLAERGVFDLAGMAERTYPLADTASALADVADRAVLGAAILPGA